jgi:hypothetical protein
MYRLFNIQQFYVLPYSVFMRFVWISEQRAIIPLHSINLTGLYNRNGECLLRGKDWIFKYNSGSLGSPCENCGRQSGTWILLLRVLQSPLSVSFHQRSTLTLIYMLLLAERKTGQACETLNKTCSLVRLGTLKNKVLQFLERKKKKSIANGKEEVGKN